MIDRSDPSGNPNHVLQAGKPRLRLPWLAATAAAPLLEPLAAVENRPLVRDVSVFQGSISADVMKANGVTLLIARAAVSWGYTDPRFAENWVKAGQSALYRSSYHVIYTDQPILDQADNWYRAHPEPDADFPIPRVIDLEIDRGDSYGRKKDAWLAMCELVHARDGLWPLTYSRYLLVNAWLSGASETELNQGHWWLAQYLYDRVREHPGPLTIPQRVDPGRVILQQTADRKPPFPGEVQSAAVDWDRWLLGDELQMDTFIREQWGGETAPPDTVPLEIWAREYADPWMRSPTMPYNGPKPPEA